MSQLAINGGKKSIKYVHPHWKWPDVSKEEIEALSNYMNNMKYNKKGYPQVVELFEKEFSAYNFEYANTNNLFKIFDMVESESKALLEKKLSLPAYDQCLKASHIFNLLEARGVISVAQRAVYISRIRACTLCLLCG